MGRQKRDFRMGSLDTYKKFKAAHKNTGTKKITFQQYADIIIGFNVKFWEYLCETGLPLKLPKGLGTLVINKYKPKTTIKIREDGTSYTKDRRAIDFVASRKYGKKIYQLNDHTNGYIYHYKWTKNKNTMEDAPIFKFEGCRIMKRTLAHYIKEKPETAAKYSSWDKKL